MYDQGEQITCNICKAKVSDINANKTDHTTRQYLKNMINNKQNIKNHYFSLVLTNGIYCITHKQTCSSELFHYMCIS